MLRFVSQQSEFAFFSVQTAIVCTLFSYINSGGFTNEKIIKTVLVVICLIFVGFLILGIIVSNDKQNNTTLEGEFAEYSHTSSDKDVSNSDDINAASLINSLNDKKIDSFNEINILIDKYISDKKSYKKALELVTITSQVYNDFQIKNERLFNAYQLLNKDKDYFIEHNKELHKFAEYISTHRCELVHNLIEPVYAEKYVPSFLNIKCTVSDMISAFETQDFTEVKQVEKDENWHKDLVYYREGENSGENCSVDCWDENIFSVSVSIFDISEMLGLDTEEYIEEWTSMNQEERNKKYADIYINSIEYIDLSSNVVIQQILDEKEIEKLSAYMKSLSRDELESIGYFGTKKLLLNDKKILFLPFQTSIVIKNANAEADEYTFNLGKYTHIMAIWTPN